MDMPFGFAHPLLCALKKIERLEINFSSPANPSDSLKSFCSYDTHLPT